MNQLYSSILICILFLSQSQLCFRETGHMIISRISEIYLEEETKSNLHELLSFFKQYTGEEDDFWYIESCLLADHLDEIQIESFKTWHFQNFLYSQKKNNEFNENSEKKKSGSALWALDILLKSLKSNKESFLDNRVFKSLNLRLLIHIIQDLHQPLHTTSTMFDNPVISGLEKGDRGGNSFWFKFDPETDGKFKQNNSQNKQPEDEHGYRLHKFLDYLMFEYKDITLPLSQEDYSIIDTVSKELIQKYDSENGVSSAEIGETYDFVLWVKEGIEYCKNDVYNGIEFAQSHPPNDEYILKMKEILERQMFKAGKRLANVLNDLYRTNENIVPNLIKTSRQQLETPDEDIHKPDNRVINI